ncbi:DUF421 domain-containing protein [Yinghuangia seranimata]|uniref:DUF421 domain-containing protein n=1 Tax=Yinghuangia seranimata TaxID=408067 RepID=UPI00248C1994|nr:YetF domain-containing protein [Yinghuangia seranimata]MDI2130683.1 DUF421 domain-containing protein [Yinghuangia seranimata]
MWHDMFAMAIPVSEKVLRTVLVYASIVVLIRVVGKRDLAQIDTGDLVVMLLLSNVVQNAIIGPDDSVTGAVIGAVTLLATNAGLVHLAAEWEPLGRFLEGTPTVLAKDGVYDRQAARRLGLRRADVDVAVKRQGGERVEDTTLVSLEPGGSLLVQLKPGEEAATKNDVALILARLEELEARLAGAGPAER